ncbi:hypothetical protein O77CONTIG1_03282 [Leptolyngbya sp. O-77]|nr:hypothetical protein O77CONTIG1_03282 [Leptolyngbya sp. O-77]
MSLNEAVWLTLAFHCAVPHYAFSSNRDLSMGQSRASVELSNLHLLTRAAAVEVKEQRSLALVVASRFRQP